MLLTRYAPFRRSINTIANINRPRLACVKPAASVHPEPGSNSSLYSLFLAPYYIDAILPIYNKKVLLLSCSRYLLYLSFNIFNEQSVEKETILISNGVQR